MKTLDLETVVLKVGNHASIEEGMCVMEAVSFVAGEPWSDSPACACPVVATFLRSWNDALPDDDRQQLKRYIPLLVGSKSTLEIERRRSAMAMDWLVRVQTTAWLRLAKLDTEADALASLPEIVDAATLNAALPALHTSQKKAAAARAAAWAASGAAARDAAWAASGAASGAAARDAAWDATWDASGAAARAAARDAAWDAAWDASGAAARAAAWDAAGDAAGAAARAAAWDASRDALKKTKEELQVSAHELVERMLALKD